MSLEKALELNTAAVSRLADLMERFKPNAATSETATVDGPTVTTKAEKPEPKKKAPAKKAEVVEVKEEPKVEEPKAEEPKAKVKEEPKAEVVEKVKEVELVDLQKVARVLVTKGAKPQALEAIERIAGKGAKVHSLDPAKFGEVLAAFEAILAELEEV